MKSLAWKALVAASLCCSALLGQAQTVNTVLIASGLSQPLYATQPVAGGPVYIVQKGGTIRAVQGSTNTVFLQISVSTAGERGLLGLAFDPNFTVPGSAGFGRFFINSIDPSTNQTVIASYRTNGTPWAADTSTRVEVLRFNQTPTGASNHKAGWIGFKPGDADHLYIATGDGGSSYDPLNQAQNRGLLLGKILRININADDFPADPNLNYAVPTNNPFYGQPGLRGEIFAFGLRNPWRCSFDRLTGDLWIGDVGQTSREEIDVIRGTSFGGQNFGWRIREGDIATPTITDPPARNMIEPALVYPRTFGFSITGGYVVRQPGSPLFGRYVFGDYGSGRVWSMPASVLSDGVLHTMAETTELTATLNAGAGGSLFNVVSFGEGPGGELFIVDFNGKVVMVVHEVPLTGLSLAAQQLLATQTTTGTVTLASPAAVDTTVQLRSSSPVAFLPASVVVPQGATSASFPVTGLAAVRNQRIVSATITATLGSVQTSTIVFVAQRPPAELR